MASGFFFFFFFFFGDAVLSRLAIPESISLPRLPPIHVPHKRIPGFEEEATLIRRFAQDSWDEGFLRELVGRLKRKGKEAAPWRDNEERCRKYHEHDRWAPTCEGVAVVKEE